MSAVERATEQLHLVQQACDTEIWRSARGIYALLKGRGERVSKATVYNNTKKLYDEGIICKCVKNQKVYFKKVHLTQKFRV